MYKEKKICIDAFFSFRKVGFFMKLLILNFFVYKYLKKHDKLQIYSNVIISTDLPKFATFFSKFNRRKTL